ncbi:bitter taste receptor 17 [Xenopus tropicalis]|uniref:Taste receptor type 2 n=1 Tax=Xenopus tropicalis TaxID=8364 RepID=A0A803KK99_XENTR|nr:bitter taste receptor 17 [Xenopus tropicalis]BAE80402.1 bitter taste receptor [Xenopus tropicalis]|eukprot:NP_001165477.1 bitter taste receptor 17 [Xenopus tropicalis]
MLFSIKVIKMTIVVVTWLCGSILNSSIVAVYLREWKNGMSLGECDRTILTIGCNNFFLQCFLTSYEIMAIFELYGLFLKEFKVAGLIFFFFFNYITMWLTACLSICYCVKLVSFSHELLIRLKRGMSSAITLFLLGSVVLSGLINVPFIWTMDTEFLGNTTLTADNVIYKPDLKFLCFNIVIGSCVPILVTSLSIGLSVMSLRRHVQQMKNNTSQSWTPQLKSHVRACRTMSLLLILNLIFFITFITVALGLTQFKGILIGDILYWSVIMSGPSIEAVLLILGNTKLKTAFSKICF